MSVHLRNGIWSVHYLDTAGNQRQKSCGKGEEGHQKAIELDNLIKEQKLSEKEARLNIEFMASPVIQSSIPVPKVDYVPQDDCSTITFEQLVSEYLANSQASGSGNNHRNSISTVAEKLFYPHFGKETLIKQITYANILEFMVKIENENSRNGRGRSPITINRYGHYLRAFFRYAIDLGYMDKNPMSRWRPKKTPPKEVKLTLEDFQKIMKNADPHLQWALEVAYHLGLRTGPSELLSLKWENIDFTKREVHVYAPKTKTYRTIPIKYEEFLNHLIERRNAAVTSHVVEYNGKPVTSLKCSFSTALKLANLPYQVRMYDVRHLFATMLISHGATIGAVSALLGHSKTSTTVNVYYHATKTETINAMNSLPALQIG